MAKDSGDDGKSDDQDAEGVLDMSQAAVKKMIAEARERGFITYDQLNKVLPPDQVSSEQIEDVIGIDASEAVEISAKTGVGIPDVLEAIVTRLPFREGSLVKTGDLLVQLDADFVAQQARIRFFL